MPALIILIISLVASATFLFSSDKSSHENNRVYLPPQNFSNSLDLEKNEDQYITPSENSGGWTDYSEKIDISEIEDKKARAEDLRSNIEDINYEIGRLRRNADSYDDDEFTTKLRRLQYEADNLSSEAGDLEADDVMSSLDETSYGLRRLKNDIESEPSYFYRDRDDDIYSRLKRSEYNTDDALSNINDFSSDLNDY